MTNFTSLSWFSGWHSTTVLEPLMAMQMVHYGHSDLSQKKKKLEKKNIREYRTFKDTIITTSLSSPSTIILVQNIPEAKGFRFSVLLPFHQAFRAN